MSNLADEFDAGTLEQFCAWMKAGKREIPDDELERHWLIVRFLRERAASREANFGKEPLNAGSLRASGAFSSKEDR